MYPHESCPHTHARLTVLDIQQTPLFCCLHLSPEEDTTSDLLVKAKSDQESQCDEIRKENLKVFYFPKGNRCFVTEKQVP